MPPDATSALIAQWWSTYATIFAGFVALVIPFIMHWLEGKRARKEQAEAAKQADAENYGRLAEIWALIERVVQLYLELYSEVQPGTPSANRTRRNQIEVESEAISRALDRVLAQPGWSDGVLIAGSGAVKLAESVSKAAGYALRETDVRALNLIDHRHHLAQLVNSRNERVRRHHGIVRPEGSALPIV